MDTIQLKRIADAIEEILRLVKKDMEPRVKKTSGGLTLGGPTQTKKTMGGGLDAYLKRRAARA